MEINFWVPHSGEFLDYLNLLASLSFVSLNFLNSLFWKDSAAISATAVPVLIMMFCVGKESQQNSNTEKKNGFVASTYIGPRFHHHNDTVHLTSFQDNH